MQIPTTDPAALPVALAIPLIASLLASLFMAGCASSPTNPSFPATSSGAEEMLGAMHQSPAPWPRPLLIVGGYSDPGFATASMRAVLRATTTDDRIRLIQLEDCETFDACRDRVIAAALSFGSAESYASPANDETIEVDVVANSMGGLAVRYAAMPPDGHMTGEHAAVRLHAVRIFTICTPHQGARYADPSSNEPVVRDMVPGSRFLERLNAALPEADYELVCYGRLGDAVVGIEHCAPPGRYAYWIATPPLELAHVIAFSDRRILADIALRLRNETPITVGEPAPYPEP